MTTGITTYQCIPHEKVFPGRKDNMFGNRKAIRKHVKEVHGTFHYGKKHQGGQAFTCHCADKAYLVFVDGFPAIKNISKLKAVSR